MRRLLNAFFYKLFRDVTFRVTLIIAAGMAVLMTGMYLIIDYTVGASISGDLPSKFCSGQSLLMMSSNPANNFGIAVPINLASFIVLEFSQGTIRNKIIAGNSKFKIYLSLFLSGLIFALSLMTIYVLLCFGLGSIFGGFDPNGLATATIGMAYITPEYLLKVLILSALTFVMITSITTLFATLFRNLGPCIPIIIMFVIILYLLPTFTGGIKEVSDVLKYINPLQGLGAPEIKVVEGGMSILEMNNELFTCGIITNLVYTGVFFLIGALTFTHSDVK